MLRAISRVPSRGRADFKAALIRNAYKLDWLPASVADNIRKVDSSAADGTIVFTLFSGTQVVDTGDRIALVGPADDVSVAELVACVERRGWTHVELTGDGRFRAEATRRLMRLAPPVEVVDNPLDPGERAAIRIEATGQEGGVDWTASAEEHAPTYAPRL